jgi:hypothetical protein
MSIQAKAFTPPLAARRSPCREGKPGEREDDISAGPDGPGCASLCHQIHCAGHLSLSEAVNPCCSMLNIKSFFPSMSLIRKT